MSVLNDLFQDIADSIRTKTGGSDKLTPAQFPGEIAGISGGTSPYLRCVTFLNHDGTELGVKPVAVGDDCADPIERGIFTTPTRESDVQYDYTFSGWSATQGGTASSDALKEVNEDRTVYAAYTGAVRYYTITYYDTDGTTVLKTESLPYGAVPSYEPLHDSYTFDKWTPDPVPVTGDASYTVQWLAKPSFAGSAWSKIAEISESGQAAEYFAVGEERIIPVTIGSNTYNCKAKIVGFNHDETEDGNKVGISCILFTLPTQTNFSTQNMYYCSSYKQTPYLNANQYGTAYFPEDLRAVLKAVKKEHNGKQSTTISTEYLTTWIPSSTELGEKSSIQSQAVNLGTTYAMFSGNSGYNAYGCANGDATSPVAVTNTGGTLQTHFWARGMSTADSAALRVDSIGTPQILIENPVSSSSNSYYLPVGFCI